MRLELFRDLHGVVGAGLRHPSLAAAMPELVASGYAGAVATIDLAESIPDFRSQLGERGLDYIATVTTTGDTVAAHVDSLQRAVAEAEFHRPRLVIAQSGTAEWSGVEAGRFFEAAARIEEDLPFLVAHQTLTDRVLSRPEIADAMVQEFPDLRLAADFGHWVWACGGLLDDRPDVVRRCAAHVVHVNAGVGSEDSPRVPDPRAPEWSPHLAALELWWSMVWDEQERGGAAVTTLTPDAGSWEAASWLGERQRSRFAER
jgi:sugar phosphate isomerase/epimerase